MSTADKTPDTSPTRGLTVEQQKLAAELKKAHPKGVFIIRSGDKIGFLRTPTRNEIAYASTQVGDQIAYTESLLAACWIGGDESIKDDDKNFLGLVPQIDQIIEMEVATLEKL